MQSTDGQEIQDQPVHPAQIRLYRYTGSTDIKDTENGKTLADLRFKATEAVTAFKKNVYSAPKEPLLNEEGKQLSFRAVEIFTDWFRQFSEDEPDGRRVMNSPNCASFARTCTEDYVSEDDPRVTGLYTMYDSDRDGKLLLEDFL